MVTVVIPAYNEAQTIGKCLDSLVIQKTNKKFVVLVVDNNSTDGTADVAKSYATKIPVTVIFESQKGRGSARARGFEEAKTEIILSTDADTVVPNAWVETVTNILEDSNISAVTGPCRFYGSGIRLQLLSHLQPMCMHVYRIAFGHYWLSGFNFGIKKTVYMSSGGFSENLNSLEDIDLSFKVRKVGQIKYYGNVCVTCSGRRFQSGIGKGLYSYANGFVDYYLRKKSNIVMSDVR